MRLISDELLSTSVGDARYKTLEAVIAPTLLNGWVDYGGGFGNAEYYKTPQGEVVSQGMVKSGVISADIFVVPAGYRPVANEVYAAQSNSLFGVMIVGSAGGVRADTGSNISFSINARWRAA